MGGDLGDSDHTIWASVELSEAEPQASHEVTLGPVSETGERRQGDDSE